MGMSPMSLSPIGMGAGILGGVLGALNNKPTAAQKALNAQMQDFNNYVNAEAKTEGFDATSVFQNLMGPLQRIVQGGPQQAGWSQSETNAYNTQAMQRGAAEARDLGSAAASRTASVNGENGVTAGAGRSAVLQAQEKAEADTSNAIASGTIQSDEAGRQNFFKAAGEEKELPGVFSTSNQANEVGIQSNTAAQKSQAAFDAAEKSSSPLGIASKALSSVGGAASTPGGAAALNALPGMGAVKKLAMPMPDNGTFPGSSGVTSGGGGSGAQWSQE
jgi:hypothetical protein